MTKFTVAALSACVLMASSAIATPFTTTSPTGGALPSGVTQVGGVVLDLTGLNGTRVVTQLAASSLFVGFADDGTPVGQRGNPLTIGTQTGFDATVLAALGGGLSSASTRITLFDGDTAPGDFDDNENTFFVNGVSFGNFTTVATQETSANGLTTLSSGFGFGNDILSTGFFSLSNVASLATLFGSLSTTNAAAFSLNDVDPYDNFYDFTRGVDGSLINVGTGPIVTPPTTGAVPEPASWAMMICGFGMVGAAMRRRRTSVAFA